MKLTIKAFVDYIEEFNYWQTKRLNWWLKYPLYLPFGAIIENYWIRKMSKCNKNFEYKYLYSKKTD